MCTFCGQATKHHLTPSFRPLYEVGLGVRTTKPESTTEQDPFACDATLSRTWTHRQPWKSPGQVARTARARTASISNLSRRACWELCSDHRRRISEDLLKYPRLQRQRRHQILHRHCMPRNEAHVASCTTLLVEPKDSEAYRSTNAMLQSTGRSTLFDSRASGDGQSLAARAWPNLLLGQNRAVCVTNNIYPTFSDSDRPVLLRENLGCQTTRPKWSAFAMAVNWDSPAAKVRKLSPLVPTRHYSHPTRGQLDPMIPHVVPTDHGDAPHKYRSPSQLPPSMFHA